MLQHVIARGIDRADIFRGNDDDRKRFVVQFSARLGEIYTECLAWCWGVSAWR